jgi:hypothetical protein
VESAVLKLQQGGKRRHNANECVPVKLNRPGPVHGILIEIRLEQILNNIKRDSCDATQSGQAEPMDQTKK